MTLLTRNPCERLIAAVLAVARALQDACDELCQLDAVAGDGDHGMAMASAARRMQQSVTDNPPRDVHQLLRRVAQSFGAVGGSMGAVSYVFAQAIAAEVRSTPTLPPALYVARLLSAGEKAVSEFGGANLGDKSVLDAISSARRAVQSLGPTTSSLAQVLLAAADGACKGASDTAAMTAQVGRAGRLGDTGLGAIDPGAMSFAIAFRAFTVEYLKQEAP